MGVWVWEGGCGRVWAWEGVGVYGCVYISIAIISTLFLSPRLHDVYIVAICFLTGYDTPTICYIAEVRSVMSGSGV